MAFTDVGRIIRRAPYRHTWVYRDANGNVQTGVSSTAANVAKDTCNPAAATNAVAAQTGDYLYYLDLTATEMDAGLIEVYATGGSVRAEYAALAAEPCLHSGVAASGASGSITLGSSGASGDNDFYNGATIEIVRYTGAGQVRTITDYTGSSRIAQVDRPWTAAPDNTSVYIIHPRVGVPMSTGIKTSANIAEINGDATAAVNLEKLYEGAFLTSSVLDASPTTTSFIGAAGLPRQSTANWCQDMMIVFTSGENKGIPRQVSGYDESTRTYTVSEAWPVAPASGDTFLIIALVV